MLALLAAPAGAQLPGGDMPRLVVGITVDQLRTDYLQMMQRLFGERGFRRLMNSGLMYDQVTFDFPCPDRASATASIYTGTTPSYNGIPSNTLYSVDRRRVESVLFDVSQKGLTGEAAFSPRNLLTSTLSDELKIASNGFSAVYSVAPTAEQAILSAGHAADGALWFNEATGKWVTSAYYNDLPPCAAPANGKGDVTHRIDTMSWRPLLPLSRYTGLPYQTQNFLFRHVFSKYRHLKYSLFKRSALMNEEVTRVACLVLENGRLGTRSVPDLLNVGYSVCSFQEQPVQEYSLEMQDTYVRLDREIALLLDAVDRKVGLDNTVIFLTSTGCFSGRGKEPAQFNVPAGEFYPKRATALLNMYLMAIYGQGDWVEGYHNREIFLNRKLIEDRQILLSEIQNRAAEFVIQMTGVQDVVTSHLLLHGQWNNRIDAVRRGYHRKLSGDLLLEIQPGWEIVYEDVENTRDYVRDNAVPAPLFFFGKNIKPQHVARPVKATEVAPTVSRLLRIRSPNGSKEPALPELF